LGGFQLWPLRHSSEWPVSVRPSATIACWTGSTSTSAPARRWRSWARTAPARRPCSRGTATVAGYDCARDAERVRGQVGLVGHSSYVYEDLTAAENLTFWATLAGLKLTHADRAAALAAVELDRAADERVRTFSAGMKRRLSLARFVLARPRVLLLDEPFTGLDQRAKKWLEEHLAAFKAGGGALLMTSHSFGRELAVADRIAILAGGAIALDTARGSLSADDIHRLYTLHAEEAS
jgi:ABC-type multidrug transport system ATPase subunit